MLGEITVGHNQQVISKVNHATTHLPGILACSIQTGGIISITTSKGRGPTNPHQFNKGIVQSGSVG